MARKIMIQGTASGVGKSLLTTALCRVLAERGERVAPFKAWNMSLNSAVTPDGHEIGRAQAVQAEAAGVLPTSDMNPILVKPKGAMTAQVVLCGKPYGDFTGFAAPDFVALAHDTARSALARLEAEYDWLIIEGAGSPAEPNLRDRDMANMTIAEMADAPVILVADMERGGAFAAVVGTYELLAPPHRQRVVGWVLNRYHGSLDVLASGIQEVQARIGKPCLGVMPFLPDLYWEEEDNVYMSGADEPRDLTVGVIRFPHIANATDITALAAEPDVAIRYVARPEELSGVDMVLLPGTKNSVADLRWLRERGLVEPLQAFARAKGATVGICGGYQMLGQTLMDEAGLEDQPGTHQGLGLLPVTTRYEPCKRSTRTRVVGISGLLRSWARDGLVGYEVHSGHTSLEPGARPAFRFLGEEGLTEQTDGCVERGGWTLGTYLHGLFDNDHFRRTYLNALRTVKGLPPLGVSKPAAIRRAEAYCRLADAVVNHLNLKGLV